jgi:phosphoenolpyruvate carboxylase
LIYEGSVRSIHYLLAISGEDELLASNPTSQESIKLKEKVVLPLLTIQQYALIRIKELENSSGNSNLIDVYKKLVIRSLYGNIHASRNSA